MLTPGLYLVTPDQADGDALVAAVAALLPARPALVQYRNKLADAAARRDQAGRLLALCRGAGVPLIIKLSATIAMLLGLLTAWYAWWAVQALDNRDPQTWRSANAQEYLALYRRVLHQDAEAVEKAVDEGNVFVTDQSHGVDFRS